MQNDTPNKSVAFFDTQFQRQVQKQDYSLNPFESRALDHLKGTILDLGSGLGNLSLESGRRGHDVLAVDASPAAVARINDHTQQKKVPVRAVRVDIETWNIEQTYDTIVAIGLLMFFRRERALELLNDIRGHVNPGGRAIVNVLTEGTTFTGFFDGNNYYLFGRNEVEESFAGWKILSSCHETFPAPEETCKEFSTVIAEKPTSSSP